MILWSPIRWAKWEPPPALRYIYWWPKPMQPVPVNQQQALVSRLMKACGGAYSPAERRKHYISGPQWAAAYQGQALFHAPTRPSIGFEEVIQKYGEIGIGYWTTHDTDVIPTEAL